VTRAGARRLARRLGGGAARLVVLERSWHLVGIDVDRDRCAEEVAAFLAGLPAPGRGRRVARKKAAVGGKRRTTRKPARRKPARARRG
jgi:carboxylesterase